MNPLFRIIFLSLVISSCSNVTPTVNQLGININSNSNVEYYSNRPPELNKIAAEKNKKLLIDSSNEKIKKENQHMALKSTEFSNIYNDFALTMDKNTIPLKRRINNSIDYHEASFDAEMTKNKIKKQKKLNKVPEFKLNKPKQLDTGNKKDIENINTNQNKIDKKTEKLKKLFDNDEKDTNNINPKGYSSEDIKINKNNNKAVQQNASASSTKLEEKPSTNTTNKNVSTDKMPSKSVSPQNQTIDTTDNQSNRAPKILPLESPSTKNELDQETSHKKTIPDAVTPQNKETQSNNPSKYIPSQSGKNVRKMDIPSVKNDKNSHSKSKETFGDIGLKIEKSNEIILKESTQEKQNKSTTQNKLIPAPPAAISSIKKKQNQNIFKNNKKIIETDFQNNVSVTSAYRPKRYELKLFDYKLYKNIFISFYDGMSKILSK